MTTTSPATSVLSKGDGTDNRSGAARPRTGWLLLIVLTGQFMALLDLFIVNVAAPTISTDLDASGSGLQLVIAGYTISYAVLLITGARIGARFGHRTAYLGGLALFTASSLACGLAADTGQLIVFRFIQGAGSALMLPQVLSLIQRNFEGERRVKALSAYSAVLASGAAAGQVAGGVLVNADLFGAGWRPVFLVNVPIGLLLLFLGPRLLPRDERTLAARTRSLDFPGLVLLAATVTLFTVPLVLGQENGWPLWGWIALALSAVLLAGFVAYESALARRGGAPLIALRVLRSPGMGLAAFRIAVMMATNAGFLFILTLHVQGGLGESALRAGLTFTPTAVVFGLAGLNWRKIPQRFHGMLAPGGFTLAALSFVAVGLTLKDGGDGGLGLYGALVGVGIGLALAYSPTLTGALATVRPQDAADASGLLVTVTQLGLTFGIAVFGTLFLNQVESPGAHSSAHALLVTSVALAGTAALGAAAGFARPRR